MGWLATSVNRLCTLSHFNHKALKILYEMHSLIIQRALIIVSRHVVMQYASIATNNDLRFGAMLKIAALFRQMA